MDKAAAETLFQEGRQLIAGGHLEQGCAKLAGSHRLDPAIGTLLNLGDCYERIDHSASAWGYFREAADMARSVSDVEREAEAVRRAAALEPKLIRLRIVVSPPLPAGLVVTRDGSPIDIAMFGSAVPIDPGDHKIEAKAPGMEMWSTVVWANKPGPPLDVSIPRLVPAMPIPSVTPSADPTPLQEVGASGQRWAAAIVGGAGLVGLGIGAAFYLKGRSSWQKAEERCPGNVCPQLADLSLEHDARRDASIATVGTSLGIAALGAGLALWLTAPQPIGPTRVSAQARSLALHPWGAGVMLRGAY